MPHQQYLHDVALEIDADGRFVYDEVDVTMMRQSGKTHGTLARVTWRLAVAPKLLRPDGMPWGAQRATFLMQHRLDARKKLERDFANELRGNRAFREITSIRGRPAKANEWKLSMNNGSENIQFGRGNYLQIDAPQKESGHGDTLDEGDLDEAWALTFENEEAVAPALATRFNAQLWVQSTAGDVTSKYLWRKVLAGRDACRTGNHGRVAYFEWSLPDDCDIDDEDVWWEYMPALGRTITPEFVRSRLEAARRDPDKGEAAWRRAYGNQWPNPPRLDEEGNQPVIPIDVWRSRHDPRSQPGDLILFAADAAPDRSHGWIAVGSIRSDGRIHFEITDDRAGVSWIAPRLIEMHRRWGGGKVVIDGRSPASSERAELDAAGLDVMVVGRSELAAFTGAFLDAVGVDLAGNVTDLDAARFRHRLTDTHAAAFEAALSAATRMPVDDRFVWGRNPTGDIGPLMLATLVVGALPKTKPPDEEEPFAIVLR